MRFVCCDFNTGNIIFRYDGHNDPLECERCLIDETSKEGGEGVCRKGRYYIKRSYPEKVKKFRFCIKEAKTKKQANYYANICANAFFASYGVLNERSAVHKSSSDLAIHNTRNLNAEINSKLLSLVNENDLSIANDKIDYIQGRIIEKPRAFAREILSVLKSTGQIMAEYSIIDLMDPSAVLHKADFQRHRIHTLFVLSFYLYEQELNGRGLRVRLNRSKEYCLANFASARTAISQLLDNCLKYCKSDSDILVEFNPTSSDFIEVSMEMTSLFFDNSTKACLTLPGVRGRFADELRYEGKGAGLGVVQRMMELNKGYFNYECFENSNFYSDKVPFATNRFVLGFMRDKKP